MATVESAEEEPACRPTQAGEVSRELCLQHPFHSILPGPHQAKHRWPRIFPNRSSWGQRRILYPPRKSYIRHQRTQTGQRVHASCGSEVSGFILTASASPPALLQEEAAVAARHAFPPCSIPPSYSTLPRAVALSAPDPCQAQGLVFVILTFPYTAFPRAPPWGSRRTLLRIRFPGHPRTVDSIPKGQVPEPGTRAIRNRDKPYLN